MIFPSGTAAFRVQRCQGLEFELRRAGRPAGKLEHVLAALGEGRPDPPAVGGLRSTEAASCTYLDHALRATRASSSSSCAPASRTSASAAVSGDGPETRLRPYSPKAE